MSQPPQPPAPDQPPVGPASWWSEIESRPDVAPPRTASARSAAAAAAGASPSTQPTVSAARYPLQSPGVSPAPAGHAPAPAGPPSARPPVSYGVPKQSRKPYPVVILAMLLVLGVGAAGASLLSSQRTSSSTTSDGSAPGGASPKAGPVPEMAPPPAPPAVTPPAAPAPQLAPPGPPLAQSPARVTPPRAGAVQSTPRPRSGKVRDEDNQRLRRAFTRYFCVHGELPASYCRAHS